MPIRQTTPQAEINAYTDARVARMEQALAYNLSVIGEQVANDARIKGSYTDRTKNLP